jgi:twitching motility protein PilT
MTLLDPLLEALRRLGGSDLHLASGRPPKVRVHGELQPLNHPPMTAADIDERLRELLTPAQASQFAREHNCDLALQSEAWGRFRVNVFRDLQGPGLILREIPTRIRTLQELGVPSRVAGLAELTAGLVLVSGPTGSGKSSTMAALIDCINRTRSARILTVEEPLEFLHSNQRSVVVQREVGLHTSSFASALKAALREDVDVLLVGELRDQETMGLALEAAEMGLLVLGTLHTGSAARAIDRVIDLFPAARHPQVRAILASTLQGVVAQVLLKRADGQGRAPACEVLLRGSSLARLIREGETHKIESLFQLGAGNQTMDQSILELWRAGAVDPTEARLHLKDKRLIPAG